MCATKLAPCPWHVMTPDGPRYCEVGPEGHDGTHVGNRTATEYQRLLAESRS